MDLKVLKDPDVIAHAKLLGATLATGADSLQRTLDNLASRPLGRVPFHDFEGGRHEVDHEDIPADMCPAFFPQKERTTLGTPKRRVALRLVRGRPVIDQLRDAVAKIEARV